MKDLLRRESVVDIQADGDPYWFNNPQYRLTSDEPLEVGQSPTRYHVCLYRRIAWGAVRIVIGGHAIVLIASGVLRLCCAHFPTTGLHKLDAAGQEVSKPFT